jgi:acyl-CoA dehydrogenase
MSELRNILTDSVNGLFGDRVTKELLTTFDQTGNDGGLWDEIEAMGLTRPLVSEENGGVGGEWRDAHVLLFAQGYHAAPAPLGETILATWLAEKSGFSVPDGRMTLIDGRESLELSGDRISGTATRVPWAVSADNAVVIAEDQGTAKIGVTGLSGVATTVGENVAKEPRNDVMLDGVQVDMRPIPNDLGGGTIMMLGAMMRAAQIAGALERVLELTTSYANERTQFGRPIGKFQAIQQELARTAGEAAASAVIAEAPFAAMDAGQVSDQLIAAAKARTSEAAGVAASVGHQTHGAIGFTYEHTLHFFTRRLWAWRSEFGNQRFWWKRIGERSVARGADNFWTDITR